MEIRGTRVRLRPITMDDLPHCTRWGGDPEVMHHVTNRTFTAAEEKASLESVLKSDTDKVFVIENEDRRPIGTCGIHLVPKNPELAGEEGLSIGLLVGEKSEWGKGYGPEVVRALADFTHRAYRTRRVWLTVDDIHGRAVRAYEKAGFRKVRLFTDPSRPHVGGKQWLMEVTYD
jgi:RimJ/RimL family protein N-acetyltransferase